MDSSEFLHCFNYIKSTRQQLSQKTKLILCSISLADTAKQLEAQTSSGTGYSP